MLLAEPCKEGAVGREHELGVEQGDYAKGARLAGNMNWALNKEIIMQFVRNILKNSKGATAIEYGLIAALIAVAAISAMTTLGGKIGTTFNSVSSNLK